jgi:hypothetical protein
MWKLNGKKNDAGHNWRLNAGRGKRLSDAGKKKKHVSVKSTARCQDSSEKVRKAAVILKGKERREFLPETLRKAHPPVMEEWAPMIWVDAVWAVVGLFNPGIL